MTDKPPEQQVVDALAERPPIKLGPRALERWNRLTASQKIYARKWLATKGAKLLKERGSNSAGQWFGMVLPWFEKGYEWVTISWRSHLIYYENVVAPDPFYQPGPGLARVIIPSDGARQTHKSFAIPMEIVRLLEEGV